MIRKRSKKTRKTNCDILYIAARGVRVRGCRPRPVSRVSTTQPRPLGTGASRHWFYLSRVSVATCTSLRAPVSHHHMHIGGSPARRGSPSRAGPSMRAQIQIHIHMGWAGCVVTAPAARRSHILRSFTYSHIHMHTLAVGGCGWPRIGYTGCVAAMNLSIYTGGLWGGLQVRLWDGSIQIVGEGHGAVWLNGPRGVQGPGAVWLNGPRVVQGPWGRVAQPWPAL